MSTEGTRVADIVEELNDAREALAAFIADNKGVARVAAVAVELAATLRSGGKVLACGNGGSCADAMHFAEELTGRYRSDRPALAAVACADPTHITCTANDYGFDSVYARWVEGLGNPDDSLILLSTSGNSANIVRAAEAAGEKGMTRIALLGKGGGEMKGVCEHEWIVPGDTADRIQEVHMLILHTLIGAIERELGHA
ncbi:MAG: SIS domain-containing protein [Planctomycetota bacterium]